MKAAQLPMSRIKSRLTDRFTRARCLLPSPNTLLLALILGPGIILLLHSV